MAPNERLVGEGAALLGECASLRFEVDGRVGPLSGFIIRYDGRIHAYENRCAHVPIELDWEPGKFFDQSGLYLICSTHGATYEPDTGLCVAGPCVGKRLKKLTVSERDGHIYIEI